jgi:signal transduction histidine kinase
VLESISKEIERLNQITEGYLVRARLPSHHSPKTELNDLIKEVLSFSSEEIRNQNIQIEPSLSDQPIFVATDRSKLKQVFLNLLKNAREAMPRGGNIRIRTSTGENISTVEIEDTGHGMNETTKSKSYTPFFTTKAGGTGLGLTLVRSLIEEANGTLSCDSKLGVGTLFRIQLPVAA